MKRWQRFIVLGVFGCAVLPLGFGAPGPRLIQKDGRWALLVDGKPYLVLGGQIHNSSAWPSGFALREIRELLSLRVSPRTSSAEIRKRAEGKIADIQRKIKTLESMEKTLRKLTDSCTGCGPITECPILESMDKEQTRVAR